MKAEEIKKRTWSSYRKEFKSIYVLTILVLIVGIIIDLQKNDLYNDSLYLDLVTIVVWTVSLLLILFNKCKLSFCFGLASYALIINILITYIILKEDSKFLLHFYRDTVFIAFILTLTAYFVNKYHAFIIAGIYVFYILAYRIFFNAVDLENSSTLMFSILAYSFIIYFFVRMQEKTMDELNAINIKVKHQNEELIQHQEEITAQRDVLSLQSNLIENRNTEILEGISFAKTIQESVLSKEIDLHKLFKQYLVISKPKSVISGDFFWVKVWNGKIYLAVIDCTGHGVPGALVSMVANMYLSRAFIELSKPNPSQILNYISNAITGEVRLVNSFHSRIGMDIALVCIDYKEMVMEFAGAFSPLYIIRRDNMIQYQGTRIMIGSSASGDNPDRFQNQTVDIAQGDKIYLFSDGLVDQFGGKSDKKLGYKRLKNLLLDTNHNKMITQKDLFWKKWMDWKADKIQVDDVLLIGIQI